MPPDSSLAPSLPPAAAAGPADPVLGVDRSLNGRRWLFRTDDERTALALAQAVGIDLVTARVLAGRGIGLDDVARYLAPSLRQDLPDPATVVAMEAAAERLALALERDETIAVFGDYDVDGATSAALLIRYFRALGHPLVLYVPDRQAEGYGPNAAALEGLARAGVTVAVTVDCGTLAHAALAAGRAAGLDIVVCDHHQADAALPEACAVVNPNRLDDRSGLGHLAAVGVAFLLVVALNRRLRAAGRFAAGTEPELTALLDLVALGTVCDVMPLTGLNRTFVTQGLKIVAGRGNPGLAALMDVAKVEGPPGAYHLGYVLGPRVNAGGRVGAADLGARLLATDDADEAAALAARLDALNRERQAIERQVEEAAIAQVEARIAGGNGPGPVLMVAGEGWHPGVVGIVAARLKERYRRPSFVLALSGQQAKGSGRSVAGVDLGAAVAAARAVGLLSAGGGHAMAAGITLDRHRLDDLEAFWSARLDGAVARALAADGLRIDGALSLGGLSWSLIAQLERLAPFGAGNAEPRFVLPAVTIAYAAAMGRGHLRLRLTDHGGRAADAIAFRAGDGAVVDALAQAHAAATPLHLAGHLRADRWQGSRRLRFVVEDAALVDRLG